MTADEIQTRIDAIAKATEGRTMLRDCTVFFKSHETPFVFITHNPTFSGNWSDDKSISFRADGLSENLDAASAWAASLPTRDEAERAAFMDKLAGVIEHGKRIGIEDGFVNPLLDLMKRISENALTHQSGDA